MTTKYINHGNDLPQGICPTCGSKSNKIHSKARDEYYLEYHCNVCGRLVVVPTTEPYRGLNFVEMEGAVKPTFTAEEVDSWEGGSGLKQFSTVPERIRAVHNALGSPSKQSIFSRIINTFKKEEQYKGTDLLLKSNSYRKQVRNICPRCKEPTLVARYKVRNNSNYPDWYECSTCGYTKKPSFRIGLPFHFKTKKLNWYSIAPKFMIVILGMFLFSWELLTFGGGEYGGQYWFFALGGIIVGFLSIISDFIERKKEEKEKEEEEIKAEIVRDKPNIIGAKTDSRWAGLGKHTSIMQNIRGEEDEDITLARAKGEAALKKDDE